jgi:hypothetical protein
VALQSPAAAGNIVGRQLVADVLLWEMRTHGLSFTLGAVEKIETSP